MAQILTMQSSKLVVGLDVLPQLLHSGQAYINGPLTIGNPAIPPVASVNVNLPNPSLGALIPVCNAIGVNIVAPTIGFNVVAPTNNITGVLNLIGIDNTTGVKTITGLHTETGLKTTNGSDIGNGLKINNAKEITISSMTVAGVCKALKFAGDISGCSGKKDFDIPHPTKKGWRLRHICIEGPTADVYFRGKLNNTNVIKLPEYWKKLVDLETIDISLTPIGSYQELFVEKIEWGTNIIVKNNAGGPVNCSYVVYGERIDTSKNIPEYEGEYGDYPGDNSEYTGGTYWNNSTSKINIETGTPSIDIHSKG